MLLRRFLAHEGYEPRLVINVTDVNDKIYDAAREAGVASAEHAARDDSRLRRGHRPARARPPGRRAARDRDDRRDRRADRGADRVAGTPTSPAATSTSASAASTATASSPTAIRTRWTRARRRAPRSSRRTRSTSRSGRRASRTRTRPGPRPGARAAPAGTSSARRWPRSCSAPTSRSTAAARTSSSPTTRTRSPRPRRRAGVPLARIWMHNGMVQHRRGEDVEVARQHLPALRGARPVRRARRWSPT